MAAAEDKDVTPDQWRAGCAEVAGYLSVINYGEHMGEREPGKTDETAHHKRVTDRAFALAEDIVYIGIALLLVTTAVVLLIQAAAALLKIFDTPVQDAAVEVLDTLLLVFIVVELLFAVRATLVKRELLAEPFLIVGIIASIKEIVVLSVKAAEEVGKSAKFDDQLKEIGVLGFLVFLLGVTAWLLRLKEREPDEGDSETERKERGAA